MPVRALLLIVVAAVAVAGCGRRGSLEEAPSASAVVDPDAAVSAGAGISPLDPGSDISGETIASPAAQQPAPPRRFLLDFLL